MYVLFFFFKQKTAYEMRISDWSSDVCSSDLGAGLQLRVHAARAGSGRVVRHEAPRPCASARGLSADPHAEEHTRWHCACRVGAGLRFRADLAYLVADEIGRAACGERVGQDGWISVVGVSLNKKSTTEDS